MDPSRKRLRDDPGAPHRGWARGGRLCRHAVPERPNGRGQQQLGDARGQQHHQPAHEHLRGDHCSPVGDVARDAVVEGNTIHDCGALPATNFEHGIYVGDAVETVIRSNYIYDNADRGIQLFPHAVRTAHAGGGKRDRRKRRGNPHRGTGADPTRRFPDRAQPRSPTRASGPMSSPSSQAGPPRAIANQVADNCLFGGHVGSALGGVVGAGVGYSTSRNLIANPHYRADIGSKSVAAVPARRQALAPVAAVRANVLALADGCSALSAAAGQPAAERARQQRSDTARRIARPASEPKSHRPERQQLRRGARGAPDRGRASEWLG